MKINNSRGESVARKNLVHLLVRKGFGPILVCLLTLPSFLSSELFGQDEEDLYSFSLDVTPTSKYLWRGQRLTDGWSLQTGGTVGVGGFSFNIWGNMDLQAVNEGDALPVSENPDAHSGSNGLQGKFSEVDYTFSYAHSFEKVTIDGGAIFYTFPERSSSLASTTEIYGGVSFDTVPLAPSATLYIDVDETGKNDSTGLYFNMAASHTILTKLNRVEALQLSGSLSIVNSGFSSFYYGASESGIHDFNFTISAPISFTDNWSIQPFVSYSALLSDFRDYQFRPAPDLYLGTAGSPATYADSVYGGVNISLGF